MSCPGSCDFCCLFLPVVPTHFLAPSGHTACTLHSQHRLASSNPSTAICCSTTGSSCKICLDTLIALSTTPSSTLYTSLKFPPTLLPLIITLMCVTGPALPHAYRV